MATINFIDKILSSALIISIMYLLISVFFVFSDLQVLNFKNEIIVLLIWTKFVIVFLTIDILNLNPLEDIVKKYA